MDEEVRAIGNESALKSGKGRIQVSLLDDTVVAFQIEPRSKGEVLYQKVNSHLKVEESDYFGLQYYDTEGNMCWLDPLKTINKQVKEALKVTFKFRVMFYTPEPNSLQEYTRYLFTLQVRRDLLDGRLHCSEETGALLASYIVQGELGDFDETMHHDGYLSGFQFVPHQSPVIEEKILEYHTTHRGKSPAEADRCMLDVARQLEMYGITLYPAKDRDDADLSLSVFHMGILVFQNQKKINMFSWAKIRKLSFKKKKFVIKLHPKVYTADLVEFVMQSRNACKAFWKICIAHHVFFRQKRAVPKNSKPSLLARGSKFRYSGRTQKQLMEDCRDSFKPSNSELERNRSSRIQRSNDAASIAVSSSNELAMLPTTPPPSYSSFKFDSPKEHNHSSQSVKNSTDASEDEGSFTIGSTRSPPSNFKSSDQALMLNANSVPNESHEANHQMTLNIDIDGLITNGQAADDHEEMATSAMEEKEDTLLKERLLSESDLERSKCSEIEKEVDSIMDQIKKKTSWQYHLTLTESDDNSLHNNSDLDQASVENQHIDGDFRHVEGALAHMKIDGGRGKEVIRTADSNGDVNSNDIDHHIPNNHVAIFPNDSEGSIAKEEKVNESDSESSSKSSQSFTSSRSIQEIEEDDINEEIEKSFSEDTVNDSEEQTNLEAAESSSFYMARDVMLTERTYIKDLEILTVSFREVITTANAMSDSLMDVFFGNIDPLYDFHCSFLAELEDRFEQWKDSLDDLNCDHIHKISDIMMSNMKNLKLYVDNINMHGTLLMEFHKEIKKSEKLKITCQEFELNKICYLPLNTFLLKPAQRLLYYKFILSRMYQELNKDNRNYSEIKAAYEEILDVYKSVSGVVQNLDNLHKLIELDRDLIGAERLVNPKRDFLREGCLYKMCRGEPQQRMFFLFSDALLYSSQGVSAANQFRIRSKIPLQAIKVEVSGLQLHGLFPFTISLNNGKSFVAAATSQEDRFNWTEEITAAVAKARVNDNPSASSIHGSDHENGVSQSTLLHPILIEQSQENDYDSDDDVLDEGISTLDRKHSHVRTLSTRRVCWHRNTSISMNEYKISAQNNISGYLFRKNNTQSKWQRLWVVFTNFSMFFFKSYEDDVPLASLPLIGYDVSKLNGSDENEEFCFTLHFKAHLYSFRAESQYSFNRWMEALGSVTRNASRARIFSRLTSA